MRQSWLLKLTFKIYKILIPQMAGFPPNLFWLFQLSTTKRVQEKYGSLMLFLLKNMFILSVQFEVKTFLQTWYPVFMVHSQTFFFINYLLASPVSLLDYIFVVTTVNLDRHIFLCHTLKAMLQLSLLSFQDKYQK